MHNMCVHVLLAAASLFSVLCLSETPPDSDQQSFCRSVEALELSIVSPLEGSYLLKGLVHFQFVTLAPPSDKLRYFVYVDEDPVIQPNSHGEDETVVFLGNESIGIHVDDVGMHVFSLVQTCSPSAWSEDGDEVDVRRVFVSFKALEATKTGRKMDGAQGADDPDVKYYLSAVAVFRDEEMYLQEWYDRCCSALSIAVLDLTDLWSGSSFIDARVWTTSTSSTTTHQPTSTFPCSTRTSSRESST